MSVENPENREDLRRLWQFYWRPCLTNSLWFAF